MHSGTAAPAIWNSADGIKLGPKPTAQALTRHQAGPKAVVGRVNRPGPSRLIEGLAQAQLRPQALAGRSLYVHSKLAPQTKTTLLSFDGRGLEKPHGYMPSVSERT